MRHQTIYYSDELNDEFSTAQITARHIDGNYPYVRVDVAGKLAHIIWYDVIARPLGYLFMKIKYHHKIIGREKLSQCKGSGYFLYGNHTNAGADPFVPSYVTFPRAPYVVVHPNNISMPVVGKIIEHLGALPLPDDMDAMKHFTAAIKTRIQEGSPVVIYPEAHIWPYYTDIRPFKDTSFHYPVDLQVPIFCFTNTYHRKKFGFGVRMVTYIDGPFYPGVPYNIHEDGPTAVKYQWRKPEANRSGKKEMRKQLRDAVYRVMKERAKNNTVELITYLPCDRSNLQ